MMVCTSARLTSTYAFAPARPSACPPHPSLACNLILWYIVVYDSNQYGLRVICW